MPALSPSTTPTADTSSCNHTPGPSRPHIMNIIPRAKVTQTYQTILAKTPDPDQALHQAAEALGIDADTVRVVVQPDQHSEQ